MHSDVETFKCTLSRDKKDTKVRSRKGLKFLYVSKWYDILMILYTRLIKLNKVKFSINQNYNYHDGFITFKVCQNDSTQETQSLRCDCIYMLFLSINVYKQS